MKLSTHVFQRISDQGMPIVSVDNPLASLELSLFGGHVLSFMPKKDNRQRLWMSPKAVMDGSKPIRGGIPVCWPWFGAASDGNLPAHGFVRDQMWQILRVDDDQEQTRIQLQPERAYLNPGQEHLDLMLELLIGEQLTLNLITQNRQAHSIRFGGALHSYFRVQNIDHAEIQGLSGAYLDKVQDTSAEQTPSPYLISSETDRIHVNAVSQASIIEGEQQAVTIGFKGHDSIVVWNPWQEKSAQMADMTTDGYRKMLCIEAAITQGIELAPGQSHILTQIIS
ncbi:D-hexose-6-phosphate mutarotase [Bowmanella pacifica]|uniref:Putative glucose-6-phosphate 1-epimerase n=1 Tax=Bowmanella pacifica TaxID=502051 RepID=A0A917Z5I3_9ALTE|nr:D-hexose-6-phosphate mutarotase [Bowmanella pacifica]GGO75318.1 D-hexose-6-phosphate mutarotase [Bowmanella pacifica]